VGNRRCVFASFFVEQWRSDKLPAGDELAGLRVSVQLDGGRTKIRGELLPRDNAKPEVNDDGLVAEDAAGRSRKRPKKTFKADWREPKLLTIFVHDENGKMDKEHKVTIDGTMMGPDVLAELVAMHLHRLGAARAASVTFCGDGAPWIWDRVPVIVAQAGLQDVPVYQVLDNCHAAHHVSLALAALGLNDKERLPLYRELRSKLRNGQWRQVVADLKELADAAPEGSKVHTEIAYLEGHGLAGRMNYVQFVKLGIPRGSGAVESGIRRVINLRLKNNATFWYEENAEIMLQLRAQVISRRWDECQSNIRQLARKDARTDWRWKPRPMSCKDEANLSTTV
jgi:hypothetical protein